LSENEREKILIKKMKSEQRTKFIFKIIKWGSWWSIDSEKHKLLDFSMDVIETISCFSTIGNWGYETIILLLSFTLFVLLSRILNNFYPSYIW
jgi:hypothetical protein